jgi:hypothetical protein
VTTILEDIETLRAFAVKEDETGPCEMRGLLDAVRRVFAPTDHGEAQAIAPEVARAELAVQPLPRELWDRVVEPLLSMGFVGGRILTLQEYARDVVTSYCSCRLYTGDDNEPIHSIHSEVVNLARQLPDKELFSKVDGLPAEPNQARPAPGRDRDPDLVQRWCDRAAPVQQAMIAWLRDPSKPVPLPTVRGELADALEVLLLAAEGHPEPEQQAPFSEELEQMRDEEGYGDELLAWAELVERKLALLLEMAGGREQADDGPIRACRTCRHFSWQGLGSCTFGSSYLVNPDHGMCHWEARPDDETVSMPRGGAAPTDVAVALRELLDVIDKGGGPGALSRGVDLAPLSYMAKLSAAIEVAEAALDVQPAPDDETPEIDDCAQAPPTETTNTQALSRWMDHSAGGFAGMRQIAWELWRRGGRHRDAADILVHAHAGSYTDLADELPETDDIPGELTLEQVGLIRQWRESRDIHGALLAEVVKRLTTGGAGAFLRKTAELLEALIVDPLAEQPVSE